MLLSKLQLARSPHSRAQASACVAQIGRGQRFNLKQLEPPGHSGAWPQGGDDSQSTLPAEARGTLGATGGIAAAEELEGAALGVAAAGVSNFVPTVSAEGDGCSARGGFAASGAAVV